MRVDRLVVVHITWSHCRSGSRSDAHLTCTLAGTDVSCACLDLAVERNSALVSCCGVV